MGAEWNRARLLDLGIAATLAAAAVAELWVPLESVQGDGSRPLTTAVALTMCGALAFRRTHPLATAAVTLTILAAVSLVAPVLVLFWGGFVPICVALFSVARHGRGRAPWAGAALGAGGMLLFDLTQTVLRSPSELVFHWSVLTLTWLAGYTLQVQERRARVSLQRAVDAEVTAAAQVMAAVVEERTRIARELHDIVAHSVSMMVVQAGAAQQVVGEDPAYVSRALDTIRASGSEALADMRRAVAMLREAEGAGSLAPQPGVGALPGLVAESSTDELRVTLTTEGPPCSLPAGLDLAVYRIAQEALTNTRRHAQATWAEVRLTYAEGLLAVEVRDNGRTGRLPRRSSPGHGLLGIRERVALYGGRVEAGPGADFGFLVRAELPVSTPAPRAATA